MDNLIYKKCETCILKERVNDICQRSASLYAIASDCINVNRLIFYLARTHVTDDNCATERGRLCFIIFYYFCFNCKHCSKVRKKFLEIKFSIFAKVYLILVF